MTRRRFIADEVSGNRAALVGSHADHLSRVLRARVGQKFDIASGSDVRQGTITSITNDRVDFELGDLVAADPLITVTLLLSIFKFDRMEWAIEKCTELGVTQIIPVIARRTDAHLASAAQKRLDRWQRLALAASEQSRRNAAPEISPPAKVRDALSSRAATRVILAESEGQTKLKDVVGGSSSVALAIGPEGGWADDELRLFADAGWIPASLGSTILRAETAAIAALAIVRSEIS